MKQDDWKEQRSPKRCVCGVGPGADPLSALCPAFYIAFILIKYFHFLSLIYKGSMEWKTHFPHSCGTTVLGNLQWNHPLCSVATVEPQLPS